MSRPEPASHTFLIRIWIEETLDEAERLAWRGHITHLPDEERRYVETLHEIAGFIRAWVGDGRGESATDRAGEDGAEPREPDR